MLGVIRDMTNWKRLEEQMRLDIVRSKQVEEALRNKERRLQAMLTESSQVSELLDMMQSCQTIGEAYRIIESTIPSILACHSGALCITSDSRDLVESVATWGDPVATGNAFRPEDCWALRRGKMHRAGSGGLPARCTHVPDIEGFDHLCVPLIAQGETLGILTLADPVGAQKHPKILERRAQGVAERLASALANLRWRDVLRNQSLRDSLTGLFNRRYMEETLERELRGAIRNEVPVALLMLDVDRFKSFNDTFGHPAGDTVLRSFGDLLLRGTRGQDVVCRYGGEEFALILIGATREVAYKRTQQLREQISHLVVQHQGQVLGKVTISAGVGVFPYHANSAEELVRAADQALYRAKSEGRDRVVTCDSFVPPLNHLPAGRLKSLPGKTSSFQLA